MKFCYECGCELEGSEKVCPECGVEFKIMDDEDIEVNRRDGQEVLFESEIVQTLYNQITFFKDESSKLIEKLDSSDLMNDLDEIDVDEFGQRALDHVSDVIEDVSKLAEKTIPLDDLPDFIEESTLNAKKALNRDSDYIRKAKRKLNMLNSDSELINEGEINRRVVGLCDKAIEVNKYNDEAYYLKGLALINLKKYDEGIEELINAMALSDDDIDIRLEIANANRLNGEYEDAISVYDSVLKIDEKSYEALKGKAFTYFDWEKYELCEEFFEKANKQVRYMDDDSLYRWIICYNKLEEFDEADKLLKKVKK